MEQETEIEQIMADNERMIKALRDISEAPQIFASRNLYTKRNQGALDAIRACATVAINALKENKHGREETKDSDSSSTEENQA